MTLMMSSEPAVVADHAFTTGRIGQVSFETPLRPTTEIIGIFDGFGAAYAKSILAADVERDFLFSGNGRASQGIQPYLRNDRNVRGSGPLHRNSMDRSR
jgi:hypothetical protein